MPESIENQYRQLVQEAESQPGVQEAMELYATYRQSLELVAKHLAMNPSGMQVSVSDSAEVLISTAE